MKLLIIGGTVFLGRHIVDAAIERGHHVTLFNRGIANPGLYPDLPRVRGDRLEGLSELNGEEFDAIIDTCAFFPRAVQITAEAFAESPARYVLISSISVFADVGQHGLTESAAVGKIEDEKIEEITGGSYGPLKALCEKTALERFGERALVVRPGLIVGPHDPTDRFTYWPMRFADYGVVLAPDLQDQPVQIIDVRDLAQWIIVLLERDRSGVYNATGPWPALSLRGFLEIIRSRIRPEARIVWADPALLVEHEVKPWADLPCVLDYDGSGNGMLAIDVRKAITEGLTFRSLETTAIDTLNWRKTESDRPAKTGLSRDKEEELLSLAASMPAVNA